MNFDRNEEGQIINGDKTYSWIADELRREHVIRVGWSDGEETHEIWLTHMVPLFGEGNEEIKENYLFVTIPKIGGYAFCLDTENTPGDVRVLDPSIALPDVTIAKISELINGVKKALKTASSEKRLNGYLGV